MDNLLDDGWKLALCDKLAHGQVAGRDFHFTYGPLHQRRRKAIASLIHERQPGPMPARAFLSVALRLPEHVENAGQRLRRDADPVVRAARSRCRLCCPSTG